MSDHPIQASAPPSGVLLQEARQLCRQGHESPGNTALTARINAWRARSPRHERCWLQACRQWEASGAVEPRPEAGLNRLRYACELGWERLRANVARQPALTLMQALCLLLILFMPLLRGVEPTPSLSPAIANGGPAVAQPATATRYASPRLEQRRHTLADGSVLILNRDSVVAVTLSADLRQIELQQGEALFEVTPDPARPFVVSANGMTASAVGTAFSVRAQTDGAARITVTEGRVAVAVPGSSSLLLSVDEQVDAGAGHIGAVLAVDAASATAWTDGMLIFRERPLGEVLAELGRYTSFQLDSTALANAGSPVTATYFIDRADSALELVATAFDLQVIRGASGTVRLDSAATQRQP